MNIFEMRTPSISVMVLLLANGCRMTSALHEADSLAHQTEPSSVNADKLPAPAVNEAGLSVLPDVVQPVSYRQQQEGQQSEETLEPLPIPTEEPLLRSNMTLADLEAIALRSNPVLAEASARVRAARGNWVQVGLPPNLVLGYAGQQLGSHGEAEQQGVYLSQEVVTGKKLRLNRQVAAWEIQRARREFEASRLRVLTDVRISYYDVLIAQRRREVAMELVRISEQGLQAAQALFQGAEVSEADPLRASVGGRHRRHRSAKFHQPAFCRLATAGGRVRHAGNGIATPRRGIEAGRSQRYVAGGAQSYLDDESRACGCHGGCRGGRVVRSAGVCSGRSEC